MVFQSQLHLFFFLVVNDIHELFAHIFSMGNCLFEVSNTDKNDIDRCFFIVQLEQVFAYTDHWNIHVVLHRRAGNETRSNKKLKVKPSS